MCGWTMVDLWSISGRDMAKLMAQIVTSGGIRMDSGGIRLDYSAAKELILVQICARVFAKRAGVSM